MFDALLATPLKKGVVLMFDYPQHERDERKFIQVVDIRDTKKNPILPSSKWANPTIERGRWLITGVGVDSLPRRYYLELCDVVYVCGPLYRLAYHIRKWLHKLG